MKIFAFILVSIFSAPLFALEVDEKLTIRVLRTSETRKTIMINRGTEDGIVEGDHAKFIVTAGIIARAVCIKVSPSRSVWAVYRLVNADFIVNDSVMTLKITPPVKLTQDKSQSLIEEDTPTKVTVGDPTQLGIPLADGAQDLDTVPAGDLADLKGVDGEGELYPGIIPEKNVEVFGMLNISGLTANTKTDTSSDTFNTSQSYHHIGIGGEIYPRNEREWYSHFSFTGSVNFMRINSQAYNGATALNDLTEFEAGINWHPTKLPSITMVFIPYIHAGATFGTVSSSYESGTEFNGTTSSLAANGRSQGFSLGFGYKFFTAGGFGVRALLDYYYRTEKYEEDEARNIFNKTVAGPRFMLGLGYRF